MPPEESLERLSRIQRTEQRLWFLALGLFVLLAISLLLLDTSTGPQEGAGPGWTGQVLGLFRNYGLSGALLIIVWLISAYFYEKLVSVRRENRELVRALEGVARTLKHRNQQLATWSQLSHSLITNFNLPRLLELIARTAAEVTEADCAAVILAEGGARHLRLAAIHDRGLQIELAERVAAGVISKGQPVCLSPEAPPEELDRPDVPWEDLVSLAAEPLVTAKKVVGALLVGRVRPRSAFPHHVLDVLDSFASQASIALEKAHLYAENQKQLDRLGKLLDDLHNAKSQLTEAEKLAGLGVLSGGVAYVINGPVAAVMARADRLLTQRDWSDNLLREEVSAVRRQAAQVAETLTRLLALARRAGGAKGEAVDLNRTLHATLDVVRPEYRASRIEIEESYAGLADVSANASQVQQAFLNLFVTQLHAMPVGGRLSIRTSLTEDDWAEVVVEGSAREPETVEPQEGLEALGVPHPNQLEASLGLAAAARIVRAQGGTIAVEADSDSRTKVRVRLPIAPTEPLAGDESQSFGAGSELAAVGTTS